MYYFFSGCIGNRRCIHICTVVDNIYLAKFDKKIILVVQGEVYLPPIYDTKKKDTRSFTKR